jgi:hypothetical protein
MPRLINTQLLSPHDIIVIGAIAIIAHHLVRPFFNTIWNKD